MMAFRAIMRGILTLEPLKGLKPPPRQLGNVAGAKERPKESADLGVSYQIADKTYGDYARQLSDVALKLRQDLSSVMSQKASCHIFNNLVVYSFCEFVPFFLTAQTRKLSDTEVLVTALDEYQSPLVELAIKQSGLKLETSRNLQGQIHVKLLDNDKEAALKKVEEFAEQAYAKVKAILAEQAAKDDQQDFDLPQSEKLHLALLSKVVAQKKQEIA